MLKNQGGLVEKESQEGRQQIELGQLGRTNHKQGWNDELKRPSPRDWSLSRATLRANKRTYRSPAQEPTRTLPATERFMVRATIETVTIDTRTVANSRRR